MGILYLVLGMMIGGATAVMVMCMFVISKDADHEEKELERCLDLSQQ